MANHVYSLIPSYVVGGQFAQNVWHWQFDDAGYPTSKAAAQALQTAWVADGRQNTLRLILSAAVTINSYRGSRVDEVGGFEAFSPINANNVGTRGAALSASGLSTVLVHYPVNLSLPRGRTFLPGVAENDAEDGIYTGGFRGAVESALTTLFDPLTLAGGGAPTATFGIWRPTTRTFFVAANTILSEVLGTQRRRMRPA